MEICATIVDIAFERDNCGLMAISASPRDREIHVSVGDQTLIVIEGGQIIAEYMISTSKYGLGTEDGSYRTPLGRFFVGRKIGDGAEWGAIFESRKQVGVWDPVTREGEDLVLSRILWLEGADPENANTRDRYIYIHGTHEEERIGHPASHGCVRMRNDDVIELYTMVDVGTPVIIKE